MRVHEQALIDHRGQASLGLIWRLEKMAVQAVIKDALSVSCICSELGTAP